LAYKEEVSVAREEVNFVQKDYFPKIRVALPFNKVLLEKGQQLFLSFGKAQMR